MNKRGVNKIVVFGATSGIVQPLLRKIAEDGKELLLVARSRERLESIQGDLLSRGAKNVLIFEADLVASQEPAVSFATECFPDFDTLLLAYGTMQDQALCQVSPEHARMELETNFVSAVTLLTRFLPHFESRRAGTIAVITSVAGDRGRRSNFVYGAAKGGLSIFLQGLRARMYPFGVRVLTIKPGPVHTPMIQGLSRPPLCAEPEVVAADIYFGLQRPVDILYTPARWRWLFAAVRTIPERWFKKLAL